MDAGKALLTQAAAAEALGVSVQAIREAVATGRLRTVILSRRPLIPRSALDELLNPPDGASDGRPEERVSR